MTIQLERQYGPFEQPLRPARSKGDLARFWAPKDTTEKTSVFPAFKKAKTPQPQKKMVSFWETQSTSRNLITTSSKSMTSLVDENRGYTPSDVANDPAKREFLTNLSKKIFSPNDGKKKQISRSLTFRVRRERPNLPTLNLPPHFTDTRLGQHICEHKSISLTGVKETTNVREDHW